MSVECDECGAQWCTRHGRERVRMSDEPQRAVAPTAYEQVMASLSMTFDVATSHVVAAVTGLRQRFRTTIEEELKKLIHTDPPCIACGIRESLSTLLAKVDTL